MLGSTLHQKPGWTVVTKTDEPRHHDLPVPQWDPANGINAMNLKSWISNRFNETASAKAVILLGHVAVPYSGSSASDNHSLPGDDHRGAWSADLYYADVVGTAWTLTATNTFANDVCPSNIELAVGRIDFARQPYLEVPESNTVTTTKHLSKFNVTA